MYLLSLWHSLCKIKTFSFLLSTVLKLGTSTNSLKKNENTMMKKCPKLNKNNMLVPLFFDHFLLM